MKYEIEMSTKFRKDYKRVVKRGYDVRLLQQVISILADGGELPANYKDHSLTGDYVDYSATVTAWDSAMVTAWDSATVTARDSATVTARDSATVTARDSATVKELHDRAVAIKRSSYFAKPVVMVAEDCND